MKVLVCGGAGFIGSAFIRNYLKNNPNDSITNIDNLTIGSNLKNLDDIKDKSNYNFEKQDIKNQDKINEFAKNSDVIVNFAAESHVDRSIANPKPFIETNIFGTYSLLEVARKNDKFLIHVSTDEIYGDASGTNSFDAADETEPPPPKTKPKPPLLVWTSPRS